MKEYKNLSDESLWGNVKPNIDSISDSELIQLLEKQLPKVSDEKRTGIQECINIIKGIVKNNLESN